MVTRHLPTQLMLARVRASDQAVAVKAAELFSCFSRWADGLQDQIAQISEARSGPFTTCEGWSLFPHGPLAAAVPPDGRKLSWPSYWRRCGASNTAPSAVTPSSTC